MLLPTLLLAFAAVTIVSAKFTSYNEVEYDFTAKIHPKKDGNVWLGKNHHTHIYLVDWQESEIRLNRSLRLISAKISNGQKEYDVVTNVMNASLSALHFRINFDVTGFPELKMPKNLEGFEFLIEYEFGPIILNNDAAAEKHKDAHGFEFAACPPLPMGERKRIKKKIALKLPKSGDNGPTEHEKDILKAIFVGGHNLRVDVARDGEVAKIDFIKEVAQHGMKFTLDYTNFEQRKQVRSTWVEVRQFRQRDLNGVFGYRECFSDTLYFSSNFEVDWSNPCGINYAEELRNVIIKIGFVWKSGAQQDEENKKPDFNSIQLSFALFTPDQLEQFFQGGTAKIFLINKHENKVEFLNGPSKFTKTLKKVSNWRHRRADRPSHGGSGGPNPPSCGGGTDLSCLIACFYLGQACA